MIPDSLYERDFYEWSQQNAQLLREGRIAEADLLNIAQEIEDIGISQGARAWEPATRAYRRPLEAGICGSAQVL